MTDTTGDMFQHAGIQVPFQMIVESAEMPERVVYDSDNVDKNQLNLFTEEDSDV